MSPTQEARDHYLRNEMPLWLAPRWTRLANNSVLPLQHIYTSFDRVSLKQEIREHESDVRNYLEEVMVLPIVYANNTRNMYKIVRLIRRATEDKVMSAEVRNQIRRFFGHTPAEAAHRLSIGNTTRADEFYGRFFADAVVVIDEVHNLCNALANTAEQLKTPDSSDSATFFYRALMEAPNARVVGLTGTPIQRTPLSLAPLFNLVTGKHCVYTIRFDSAMANDHKMHVYTALRPHMETVWTNLVQGGGKRVAFSTAQLNGYEEASFLAHLNRVLTPYHSTTECVVSEHETFPFGFQHNANGHSVPLPVRFDSPRDSVASTHRNLVRLQQKAYFFDNLPFMAKYTKKDKAHNVYDFVRRITGYVSYISPPKVTTSRDDREQSVSINDQYPQYAIHTMNVSASPSHQAYLTEINRKKREINQKQADVEQRSACNVNWKVIPTELLDGKSGVLKLFFKGGTQQAVSTRNGRGQQPDEILYHAMLYRMHTLFATGDQRVAPFMVLTQKLPAFSPKFANVLKKLMQEPHHKSVVYSSFIDGIGSQPHPSEVVGAPDSAATPAAGLVAPQTSVLTDTKTNANVQYDDKRVGLSGLGLLSYILEYNTFVRLRLKVLHPLEPVHRMLWERVVDRQGAMRVVGATHLRDPSPLTFEKLLGVCATIRGESAPPLSEQMLDALRDAVKWDQCPWRVLDFCRRCLLAPQFSHQMMADYVHFCVELDPVCRAKLMDTDKSVAAPPVPVFVEYNDRCVVNATSKQGIRVAKQAVLDLYNLKRDTDVANVRSFSTQMRTDVLELLKQRRRHRNKSHRPGMNPKRSSTKHRTQKALVRKSTPPSTHLARSHLKRSQVMKPPTSQRRQTGRSRQNNQRAHPHRTRRTRAKRTGGHTKHTTLHSNTRRSHNTTLNTHTRRTPTTQSEADGNAHGAIVQVLLVSTSVTEGVEFKDVRSMHILEPPNDYKQLEQMFGRVIRRGSHAGLSPPERDVSIFMYVLQSMRNANALQQVTSDEHGNAVSSTHRLVRTSDDIYWNRIIRGKYEKSQEFYQLMKYAAVDCRHNLALNAQSFQDRSLTCFEYPYQRNMREEQDTEAPLYYPHVNDDAGASTSSQINLEKLQKMYESI